MVVKGLLGRLGLSLAGLSISLFPSDNLPAGSMCSHDEITPVHNIRTAYPNEDAIKSTLADLEKVPDPLQRKANENGYLVNIVSTYENLDTDLMGLPEIPPGQKRVEKGGLVVEYEDGVGLNVTEGNQSYTLRSNAEGKFTAPNKTAYIPQVREQNIGVPTHEYGHLQDHATGLLSNSPQFLSVYNISVDRYRQLKDLDDKRDNWMRYIDWQKAGHKYVSTRFENHIPIEDMISRSSLNKGEISQVNAYGIVKGYITDHHVIKSPTEFWAGVFSAYYDSKESRETLSRILPEAYSFIHNWEIENTMGCK